MIKFLHDSLGYDIIAFESSMYDCYKVNQILKTDSIKSKDLFKSIFGVWECAEVKELFDYLIATQKTAHPIEFAGFDHQFSKYYSSRFFKDDFLKFTDSLSIIGQEVINFDSTFYNALAKLIKYSNYFKKPNKSDTIACYTATKKLIEIINKNKLASNTYFGFWEKMCFNIQAEYRHQCRSNISIRDSTMANNIQWISNVRYPDKKLVLWAASIHLAYNTNLISEKSYQFKTTGEFLKNTYKDEFYSIAFTANSGKFSYGFISFNLKKSKPGSLEYFIQNKCKCPYAFFSFNNNDNLFSIKFNEINSSKFFGRKEIKMEVSKIFDGVFYIREMKAAKYKF
ncbi:MAG: erythromycin esterase family protein [Alphaproteobacteria bacterium]|nr:erythromycin esterase family protein [Alphaproteobacteria bacterium]